MKCKACNGTGYVTACVYESDEIGFVDKNYECAVCHGTGQIEQTNEEWFNGLSTEEKAKYIAKSMYFYDMGMPMGEALRASIRHEQGLDRTLEDGVIEWLKQPHTEKE